MTTGRRPLPADLRERAVQHVERLARRLGATIVFSTRACYYRDDQVDAVVDYDTRRIDGPHITSALEYLAILHELGHLTTGYTPDTPNYFGRKAIVDEGAAWAWAAERADPEIMAHMPASGWALVGAAFVTYVKHYAGRAA